MPDLEHPPLLVRGGEIVTASSRTRADLLCQDQRIVEIGPGLTAPSGARTLDASGCLVFPGFIDPHTHIYLPFMGTFGCDTYPTATRAALLGGTTTVFDMCIPSHEQTPQEVVELWNEQSTGQAACDYSYHLGITRWNGTIQKQLESLLTQNRFTSLKLFLAYKGAFDISESDLYHALKFARKHNLVAAAHCENATLIAERQAELLAEGKTTPRYHQESRPPFIEALGVSQFLAFVEQTGASAYIVHLSCREALERALEARKRGVSVQIETLIQYLTLDDSLANTDDFSGAKYVMSPPLRDKSNQPVLWNALAAGEIDTVATDHAPFHFNRQKTMGKEDFSKIPNGIPALEERIALLYTHGVRSGKISAERMVEVASTNPAKIFGLYPRKGTIAVGSDADLVVFDPTSRTMLSSARHHSSVDYNAFEGTQITGAPRFVTLRGQVVVENHEFTGNPTGGRFLPSHKGG